MKVLYIGDMVFGNTGGKDVNETEFVRALNADKSVEKLFLASYSVPSGFDLSFDLSNYRSRLTAMAGLVAFLFRLGVFERPDIIFHRQSYFSLIIAIWAFIFRIDLHIKHFVPNTSYIKGRDHSLPIYKRYFVSVVNQLICLVARNVDCATEKQVENAKHLYPYHSKKFIHIENGIFTNKFGREIKGACKSRWLGLDRESHVFVLGYVGALPWERCGQYVFPVLIELVEYFKDKGFDFVFLVAGGGDDFELRCPALPRDLQSRVVYKSVVPYEDVPSIISAMDLLVALDDFERVAYLGNAHQKVRQAIASKVPVITANFWLEPYLGRSVFNIYSYDQLLSEIKVVSSIDTSFEGIDELDIAGKVGRRLDLYR